MLGVAEKMAADCANNEIEDGPLFATYAEASAALFGEVPTRGISAKMKNKKRRGTL